MSFWRWYGRSYLVYRSVKSVRSEITAYQRHKVAENAAAYAIEQCRAAGLDDDETLRIAERAASTAAAELGTMPTIARNAMRPARASNTLKVVIVALLLLFILNAAF